MLTPVRAFEPEEATELPRFWLTHLLRAPAQNHIERDVRAGLSRVPKRLSPKYFYDERGSQLFDAICDLPEYYQTRTEERLLERCAEAIVARAAPSGLIELGSGAARKTRLLLDHVCARHEDPRYVPVDISEGILVDSARALLDDYPTLRVHGVVADYDHHLHLLPSGPARLIAFLGGTIGNFSQPDACQFLHAIASGMSARDTLLLGVDLVKAPRLLHDAYNDAAGVTAAFNENVLAVINRALGADFDTEGFAHRARYLPEQQQIEMYLVSRYPQRVSIEALGCSYAFAAGEHINTELSRKFTRSSAARLVGAAGLTLEHWYQSPDDYFALLTARRRV